MRVDRVHFEEVSIKRTVRFVEGGKRRQVTRRFWQTLNPFNKNPDGSVKTREQVRVEIEAEALAWLQTFADRVKGGA